MLSPAEAKVIPFFYFAEENYCQHNASLKGLLPIAGHYEQNWEMTPLFSRKPMIFIRTLSTFSQNI